jgi:hypothetical protein
VDEDTIFVSIAVYRDPELGPTIEDCLAKARWSERLHFRISWDCAVSTPDPYACPGGLMLFTWS